MSPQNLTNVYNQNPTLQSQYTLQQYLDLFGGSSTPPTATIPPQNPNAPVAPINQGIIGADINTYQGGGGGGGITELQQTYTTGAQPRGPKTDFNINPAAQLTGKGRLDPMGSDLDYFNAFYRNNDPRAFTSGLKFDNVPGQPGYQAPSKYFNEPNLLQKGITATKDFFSNLGTPKVRGTLGDRLANQPRLPLPAAIASWSLSPFNEKSRNYNPDFVGQLNFLEGMDGTKLSGDHALMKDGKFGIIEGQSMIGRDQGTGLLKYGPGSVLEGKNVISLAGTNNYQTALENYIEKMKGYKVKTDFQKAKIARAEKELQTYLDNEKKKEDKKKEIITKKTIQDNKGGGGGGSWGGHGSVEAYDKANQATYDRAVARHRGAKGGRIRSYFDGGLVSLRRR